MASIEHIHLPLTALYAGFFGIMLVVLGSIVIRQRIRARVDLFDGGDPLLARAIRTHGNFIEYVPLALILMAVTEVNGAPDMSMHVAGTTLLIARLFHAFGLMRNAGPTAGRLIGTVGTFVVILVLAAFAVMQYNGYMIAR